MADVYFYKNIEFDINGSFTMDFLTSGGVFSENVRNNYFSGARLFANISDNNIYLREDFPTRIAYNIDTLRTNGVNYIKFRNLDPVSNTFSRWYYAFIENLEYVDANTTAMTIKIDVLQTYMKELYESNKEQFIERCHQDRYEVNGTPIFNTLKDVPNGETEIEVINEYKPANDIMFYIITSTEALAGLEDDPLYTNFYYITPPNVQNTANALFYYIIPAFFNTRSHVNDRMYAMRGNTKIRLITGNQYLIDEDLGNPSVETAMKTLWGLLEASSASIVSVQCVPFAPFGIRFTKSNTRNEYNGYDYTMTSSNLAVYITYHHKIEKPIPDSSDVKITNIGALKIDNEDSVSKLDIGNYNFTSYLNNKTNINFNQNSNRDPLRETKIYTSGYMKVFLSDYNNIKEIKNEHIKLDNDNNLKITFAETASIVGGATIGLQLYNYEATANNIKYVTDFISSGNSNVPFIISSLSNYYYNKMATNIGNIISSTAQGAVIGGWAGAAIGATSGIFGTIMNTIQADLQPDTAMNSNNNEQAFKNAMGYIGFILYANFPRDYKPICDFWNLNGYPLSENKKISDVIKSRYWFNFIKTAESQITNISFMPHRLKLQELLNNGVRFWHNRSGTFQPFNDYSLENAEV